MCRADDTESVAQKKISDPHVTIIPWLFSLARRECGRMVWCLRRGSALRVFGASFRRLVMGALLVGALAAAYYAIATGHLLWWWAVGSAEGSGDDNNNDHHHHHPPSSPPSLPIHPPPVAFRLPAPRAYAIALDPVGFEPGFRQGARELARELEVVPANRGGVGGAGGAGPSSSSSYSSLSLPLYTRHVMRAGRADHMQLPNRAALGCLLSHAAVWARIVERADQESWALVFEEDVVLPSPSSSSSYSYYAQHGAGGGGEGRALIRAADSLLAEIGSAAQQNWSLIMLDPPHLNTDRSYWRPVGEGAATCRHPSLPEVGDGGEGAEHTVRCQWFGTRAYAIRPRAAARLLQHVEPLSVQVDALISLVAAYYPEDVGLYWTTARLFPINHTRPSTIFDYCIKCYVPNAVGSYIQTLMGGCLFTMVLAAIGYGLCRRA